MTCREGTFSVELDLKQIRNTLLVRLRGEMDMLAAERLRQDIDKKIDSGKINNLIINLEGVTFIDSSGLGVLIGRYKKMVGLRGKMFIVGPRPSVRKILIFSGINKLVSMYNSEQDIINI
jgi:stage II sporulation protein AA (anti-sigma F factor antagonist)